jgi:3'-phosphoadenosine 5'-phosphosulfate sulfotransferase (PAPS reductase)/FAD synthetase
MNECPESSVNETPEVAALLAAHAVVAVGVSGGKDSHACAIAVARHLDAIEHAGPRVLVHADLGRIEWKDSLPACQRLAEALGWELLVVERPAGDMIQRWETRWTNNVRRYAELECMKLILPWSTPSMRFCTSELKVDVICRALRKRWPTAAIVNASGIRRSESPARAKMPVSSVMPKLQRKAAAGLAWNPIIDWSVADVWRVIEESGVPAHEAYAVYGASRVSCSFCIMSSASDLLAASGCAENADAYRLLVDLEARSTFAFQGARWLSDVAPQWVDEELRRRIERAKRAAGERQLAEAELPADLLYAGGWPTRLPAPAEAEVIARVRRRVGTVVDIDVRYTESAAVIERFGDLLAQRAEAPAVE